MSAALATFLIFPATSVLLPPPAFRLPSSLTQSVTAPGQVVAQGIARLPRGEAVWTVRHLDVPGEGATVESFPLGFAIADAATVAVRDEEGEVLGLLATGEAAFLPNGKGGSLASWQEETASLYEIALVSARDAEAGEASGSVVGVPFATPEGGAFEIELTQAALGRDQEVTIPVSRSGAPVLFLHTGGTVQLTAAGDQVVDLAAEQSAFLTGEVLVRGTSDEPATFVVAAIGEATGAAAAAGTPEARAGRGDRDRNRDRSGGNAAADASAQGEDGSGGRQGREKRAKRARTGGGGQGGGGGRGGQAGQTQPAGTGSGDTDGGTSGAPVTGSVDTTPAVEAPAGTPGIEPTAAVTVTPDATVPADGTPAPEATTAAEGTPPAESTVSAAETAIPGAVAPATETTTPAETAVPEVTAIPEETAPAEVPAAESVPEEPLLPEATLPVEEAPVEEAPVEEAPAVETVPAEPAPEEQPAEPTPPA